MHPHRPCIVRSLLGGVDRLLGLQDALLGEFMDTKSAHDFDTAVDRKRCWESIIRDEPLLVIGSPQCTMFSRLQELNKFMYRNSAVWMEKSQLGMEQAKR